MFTRRFHWRGRKRPKARLQSSVTGLPAWKHGQPGQVGNEAALTVVTSAGVRLVTYFTPLKTALVAVFSFVGRSTIEGSENGATPALPGPSLPVASSRRCSG